MITFVKMIPRRSRMLSLMGIGAVVAMPKMEDIVIVPLLYPPSSISHQGHTESRSRSLCGMSIEGAEE